jgi:hypothetical protein
MLLPYAKTSVRLRGGDLAPPRAAEMSLLVVDARGDGLVGVGRLRELVCRVGEPCQVGRGVDRGDLVAVLVALEVPLVGVAPVPGEVVRRAVAEVDRAAVVVDLHALDDGIHDATPLATRPYVLRLLAWAYIHLQPNILLLMASTSTRGCSVFFLLSFRFSRSR